MKYTRIFITIGIILAAGVLFADQNRISQLFREGDINYRMALEGERATLDAAVESFQTVLSQQPNNLLAQVLLGGCYALKGQGTKFVFYNLQWGIKGLNLIDKAVEIEPDNFQVRLERAINSLHLNSFFNRDQLAGKDLMILLDRADFSEIPKRLRQLTWLYAGLYFKQESRLDTSMQLWHKIVELDSESDIAGKAQKILRKYKE